MMSLRVSRRTVLPVNITPSALSYSDFDSGLSYRRRYLSCHATGRRNCRFHPRHYFWDWCRILRNRARRRRPMGRLSGLCVEPVGAGGAVGACVGFCEFPHCGPSPCWVFFVFEGGWESLPVLQGIRRFKRAAKHKRWFMFYDSVDSRGCVRRRANQ